MPIEPFDFTYTLTPQSEENEVLNTLGKGRIKEYEPKSYFFTESTLTAQDDSQGAYGPVDENKFNITTQFQLANKKAYAVTSGQVLIVPQTGTGNESKVNVFIKPLKHVDVGVPIKYYVYRGLKKELFVDSNNNIVPKHTSNTPFMAKVWTDLINHNKLAEPLPQIPASLFGYTTTETSTNSLDAKFFNTYDSTITDENKVYNLAIVEAGQYFGDFKDDKGGFEIVLNDGFYYQEKSGTGFQFDLNYARAEKFVIDIADIASNPNISEKIYRENVQNFLDPAAFYGAHITEKEKGEIKVVDNTAKYSTKADIYNNLVSKFYNKHKCYIYIQDNKARSFNFDETLGTDPLKIGISETLAPNSYKTNEWPIIINEFEQTHTEDENEKRKNANDLSLQLKFKTDNKNVTLYNTYGNCANEAIEGNFLSNTALINEANIATQEYTNNVNYKLINNYNLIGNSLITKNIATFIYINHEEIEVEYFNNFFGPVQIDHLIKINNEFSQKSAKKTLTQKVKLKSNSIDGGTSISKLHLTTIPYLNTNQIPQDDLFKLYILKKIDYINNRTFKVTTSSDIKYSTIQTNDDYGQFEYGDKNYKVWKGEIKDGEEAIKTLQLINFEEEGNVTNFMQLGLMNDDYKKVIYDSLTSTTTHHIPDSQTNIYFHLGQTFSIVPNSLFKKYTLGLKTDNNEIIYPSPENAVYVYTVDGHYFFTKEFSEKFNFVEEFADATINFESQQKIYTEAYGLDFMRLHHADLPPPQTVDYGYEESILGGYKFDSKEDAFQGLKKEYITIATKQNNLYYVPYLNIYPSSTAETLILPPYELNLTATIDIKENLTKLELNFDNNLFFINTIFPLNLNIGKKNFDIHIICDKEFNRDQYIKIMAHSLVNQVPKVKLAGIIKVAKNSTENRKKIKIALFEAETNDTGSNIEKGAIAFSEIDTLRRLLYQSYIDADIMKIPLILDLKDNPKFKRRGLYIDSFGKIFPTLGNSDYDKKQDDLKEEIDRQYNSKYKDYFRIIAFNQGTTDDDNTKITEANVQAISKHSACLYGGNPTRNTNTLAHEVCHGLGLLHTHADGPITDPRQKFIFPNGGPGAEAFDVQRSTDNIMSYNVSITKRSIWRWQTEIMHNNIKYYEE